MKTPEIATNISSSVRVCANGVMFDVEIDLSTNMSAEENRRIETPEHGALAKAQLHRAFATRLRHLADDFDEIADSTLESIA